MEKTLLAQAMAHPVRREILEMLKKDKMSAGAIAYKLDISGAAASAHLSALKKAGLIYDEKGSTFVYYHLAPEAAEKLNR